MVPQEPVKVAVWHALNTYCFTDAIFLTERLYAEVRNEEVLHLLATCYHRAGHTKRTYNLLKKNTHVSIHNRYLFATACFALEKFPEAELSLTGSVNSKSITNIASEFGSLAGVTLQLLGNVYRKSNQLTKAAECYKQSLKCNPFLWSSFESLCQIGEKINPLDYFKSSACSKIPHQQQYSYGFSVPRPDLPTENSPTTYDNQSSENLDPAKVAPLLTSTLIKPAQDLSSTNASRSSVDCDMPPPPSFMYKSNRVINKTRQRLLGSQASDSPITPSFGVLPADSPIGDLGSSPIFITPPVTNLNTGNPILKAPMKAAPKNIGIKTSGSLSRQFSMSSSPSSNRSTPSNDSENISLSGLRRSSRLFGSHAVSSKDLKRTPRVHFADGSKPTGTNGARKAKSRIMRSSVTQPLTPTTQNIIQTSITIHEQQQDLLVKADEKPKMLLSPIQKSADGLMHLLQNIAKGYYSLSKYECSKAITLFENLPIHQLSTCWVMEKLAIAYYECGDLNLAEKAFEKVRELDSYYINEGMAIYSSLMWLTRKECLLSSLAQDLVDHDKLSPVSWCAMANCFSLQKEHDLAIKYLERAIQLDPGFTYAYTLLGHEYVFTEELDHGLSCFRSALRYNEHHYNAWYGIGMIYYKQEKYNLAQQHYQRALKINPKSSVLLCHLAVTQHDLGNIELALETVGKASELNPENALCKYHKARFLLSLNRFQEALDELIELKKIVPKDSLVYFMTGKVYQKLNEPHLAQMNFSWAMSLDPQGTNTMIKEAMNQQHYVSDDFMQSNVTDDERTQNSLTGLSIEDEMMSDVEENDL